MSLTLPRRSSLLVSIRDNDPVMRHKGMLHAARAMAVTAAQLIDDSNMSAQANVEFEQATGDVTCKAAIPEGAELPKPHI